jgi:hypothetical protein
MLSMKDVVFGIDEALGRERSRNPNGLLSSE